MASSRDYISFLTDPLIVGVWGVVLQILALGLGSYLLSYGKQLSSGAHLCGLVVGGGLFGLAAFMLTRVYTTMSERSKALASLPGPSYNSIFGMVWMLKAKDPHRWTGIWANKYGPLVRLRILFFHAVMVTDPALAMHILYSPLFDKFGFVYSFLDPLLNGSSILTGPTDEHWKAVRKGVAPAFSTAHMREALRLVVERSNQLVDFLRSVGPHEPQNVDKLLLRESMDVIGQFGFQKDMHALSSLKDRTKQQEGGLSDVDVLLGATHEVESRLEGPLRVFQLWKKELWHGAYLLRCYQKQVAQLLSHIKRSDPREGSFAQLLLGTKHYKTGKPLSDKQMTPEIAALFFAGIDTTGHTGTWLLYLLTQNPEVEAKVVAELEGLELLVTPLRPHPRSVTYADLAKLEYLQCVVKEVLRMYPPVGIGQLREAKSDVSLAGKLAIPRGTIVWVPHYGIQNAEHNWEEPDRFLPERWMKPGTEYAQKLPLDKEWYKGLDLGGIDTDSPAQSDDSAMEFSNRTRRPKRYFPFAEGPRNCVGQSLAKVSLVATAATLLSSLTFRLADEMGGAEGVRTRERYTLITGVVDGMWMHAIPRPGVQTEEATA